MEFKEHWTEKDWARRAELNKELAELRGWEKIIKKILKKAWQNPKAVL
jgi:hypothetical protein